MKFKKSTRYFGQHSIRVRKSKLQRYMDWNENNPSKFKNRKNSFINKYITLNKVYNKMFKTRGANDEHIVTPLVEDEIKRRGIKVNHTNNSSTSYNELDKPVSINIGKHSPDSDAAHELQHAKNSINSKGDTYRKYKESDVLPEGRYTTDNILNYANNVVQEELSANRGRVVNNYLYGKNKAIESKLNNSYEDGIVSQNTYNVFLGEKYRPLDIGYHMSPEAYNNMKHNQYIQQLNKNK